MNRGFTLIELIIYITLVAGVLTAAVNFGWDIIYGNIKSHTIREVQQNTRFALEKITENILGASGINDPRRRGDSSNSLSLDMQDLDLDPTIFEIVNDQLVIYQGVNGPYALTNDRVKVTNLQFTDLSYPQAPGTIGVQLTIEHVNPNNLKQYETSLDTRDTASLRR